MSQPEQVQKLRCVEGTFILLLVAEAAWKAGFARAKRMQGERQRTVVNASSSYSNHAIGAYEIADVGGGVFRTYPGRVGTLFGAGRPAC
jgi:hypothetical protein